MISKITTPNKIINLTFDDGPEPNITEFVLAELEKYDFKATFFCRGDNAEKYPELLQAIKNKGHVIGNHTYSHIHSFKMKSNLYVEDVHKCDSILRTNLFRPPHGSLTFLSWLKLQKKFKIFYWSLNSGDSDMNKFDYFKNIKRLKEQTNVGEIVLFHFCHKHEKETRVILPTYLQWLFENGYKSNVL